MKLIYLIGAPGSGKTTLTKELQHNWKLISRETKPFKHETYQLTNGKTAINLGHTGNVFAGTDTLSYTAINQILEWLPTTNADYIYGEGDRLANERFFTEAAKHAQTFVFYLNTNPAIAADRRMTRAIENNTKQQNPTWLAGRATKHANLAHKLNATNLDGNLPAAQLCGIIWNTTNNNPTTGWD